jgi:hypothetical protein
MAASEACRFRRDTQERACHRDLSGPSAMLVGVAILLRLLEGCDLRVRGISPADHDGGKFMA